MRLHGHSTLNENDQSGSQKVKFQIVYLQASIMALVPAFCMIVCNIFLLCARFHELCMGGGLWQRDRGGENASQLKCEIGIIRVCIPGTDSYQLLFGELDGFLGTGKLFAAY